LARSAALSGSLSAPARARSRDSVERFAEASDGGALPCGVRKVGSRGVAVFVDESAEAVAPLQFGCGRARDDLLNAADRCRRCEVERAVQPVRVVVIDEDAEHVLEVAAVQDQEPVEAFSAGGADEALGDRVRFRCAQRGFEDLDAFAGEDGVEDAG
jgi:hypothetical protein